MKHTEKIPNHIAIILDGNGRWATQRGQERLYGHAAGAKAVRKTVESAVKLGVKYLTIYAFSTENWGRPQTEVDGLMELLGKMIVHEAPDLKKNGVKLIFIGDRNAFSDEMRMSMNNAEEITAEGCELTLVVALNYSARWEITEAMRKIAMQCVENKIEPNKIDEKTVAQNLCTAEIPDPDLLIRTSGECRLSNFMLWQSAYTELYFTETLWPDFDEQQLIKAITEYTKRDRRFGLIK